MSRFVLDASVAGAWLLDENEPRANAFRYMIAGNLHGRAIPQELAVYSQYSDQT